MLHSVDKDNINRSSPSVNIHDQLTEGTRLAHGTNSVNYVSGVTNLSKISGALNGQQTVVSTLTTTTRSVTSTASGAGNMKSETLNGATVAHNLPFIPSLAAYYGSSSTLFGQLPSVDCNAFSSTNGVWISTQVSVDATNVYINFSILQFGRTSSVTLAPLNIKVFLMQQLPF